MIASLLPLMNMLTTGTLGALLSPELPPLQEDQPLTHLSRIIRKAQVFYFGLDSLSDASVGTALGSIMLADLATIAGDRYNYEVQPTPINVFVDEAAEVVNDPCIQLLNKGRGAKIRMTLATQTFADFAARTGSEAKARQILGNLNTLVSLRVQDAETQRYIAESFPKVRIHTLMRTQGTTTLSQNPAFYTGNLGERLMEEEVDLVPSALLGQLPDLEYFARLPGGEVYKGRLPILERDP
jgi:conjugal transfer pilus assembly protein TraD